MTTLLANAPETTTLPQQAGAPAAAPPAAAPPAAAAASTASPVRPPLPAARRLVLSGALSRADAAELEARLADLVRGGARTVEVDLSRVPTMDAAVARLLLRTSWRLGDPARALLLLHPTPQVRRVLRFSGAGHLVVR